MSGSRINIELTLVVEGTELQIVDMTDHLQEFIASRIRNWLGGFHSFLLSQFLKFLQQLIAYFLEFNHLLLHPRMLADLGQGRAVRSFIAEHLYDEILEFIRFIALACLLPVLREIARHNQIIEVVILLCFWNGKMPHTIMKSMTPVENISI